MSDIDDFHVRTATQSDLPSVLALYEQLNPSDPPVILEDAEAILKRFEAFAGSAIFVGCRRGAPVTTCALVVVPNLTRKGAPYAVIENVVTDARHRKQGYARAVLHAAIGSAWLHGCYKVMLLTGSKNPATLRFYEQTGFEQSKTGFQIRRLGS
ncbi:GNAT family N-acetyltransferase [Terrarubrum flagellatum]|uniref:GNAT family N-acetyltransferase n=1 Tax=Terrirubrum flagellatum TaxID=2895980 RepID=UPI003144E015